MDFCDFQGQALYEFLKIKLRAKTEGLPYPIANLANASALLWQALERINWVGFYLRQGDRLILGPFQGKPACVEIPWGTGDCGTAAQSGQTQRVEDVHAFPGHIACDSQSRSEIVIPLFQNGEVVAVLDIDSPEPGRFTKADQEGLEALIPLLESILPC